MESFSCLLCNVCTQDCPTYHYQVVVVQCYSKPDTSYLPLSVSQLSELPLGKDLVKSAIRKKNNM